MKISPAGNARKLYAAGVLLSVVSMLFAVVYLQRIEMLDPCPLCVLDRAVVIGLGVTFLLAFLHNPLVTGRRVYMVLAAVLAIIGIAICARHIWLQNLPADQVPACGAGFWYMLDSMPLLGFLETVLNGSGECADIQWTVLGLTLPEQTLILFVVFLALSVVGFFMADRQSA